ncbi:MAG: acyltransferase domain-containing protein, partial [Candidatus Sericytochromatia bacterium]
MGSQQPDMARELLQHPVFYNLVEKIDQIMTKYHDWSLLDEIKNIKEQNIERVQPILFSLQLGLSELFKYYGISPDRVIGSSVGEVAGAYISGALSLEDSVKVICIRNKAMCSMIGTGCMAIVKLNESDTANFIKDFEGIYISAVNSPTTTILSGTEENITKVLEAFKSKDIWARIVKGAEAPSHCELMEPVKNYLLTELADITPIKSNISMFSTFTTQEVKGEDLIANYWWENVLRPIELKKTIENLEQKNNCIYVELSPHPVLTSFIKETCQSIDKNSTVLASLSRDISDLEHFFTTLGRLYQNGFEINWEKFFTNGKLISLPNYAWDKESYWQDYSQDNTSKVSLGLTTRYKTDKKVKVENYELNNEILENTPTEKRKELISNYLRYHV